MIIQNPNFEIAGKYAVILNTMWITFLYAPLIPIALVFGIIGLIFFYWVQKYNIVRRSTIQEALDCKLSIEMIELLEYIIILYALGNIIIFFLSPKSQIRENIIFIYKTRIILHYLPLIGNISLFFSVDKKPYYCY